MFGLTSLIPSLGSAGGVSGSPAGPNSSSGPIQTGDIETSTGAKYLGNAPGINVNFASEINPPSGTIPALDMSPALLVIGGSLVVLWFLVKGN